jgi:hypothetical protein
MSSKQFICSVLCVLIMSVFCVHATISDDENTSISASLHDAYSKLFPKATETKKRADALAKVISKDYYAISDWNIKTGPVLVRHEDQYGNFASSPDAVVEFNYCMWCSTINTWCLYRYFEGSGWVGGELSG